jgi:hypothetical protein
MMEPRVYRNTVHSLVLAACGVGFVLLGLSGVTDAEIGKVARWMYGAILMWGLYSLVRAVRASVRVDDQGVSSYGYVRTRRYTWEEIGSIELSHAPHMLPWYLPVISPVDGKARNCEEVSSLVLRGNPDDSRAGKVVDEIKRRMQSRRQSDAT